MRLKISARKYFFFCLMFPPFCPPMVMLVGELVEPFNRYVGQGIAYMGMMQGILGIFMAIPYIIFAITMCYWLRKKSEREIQKRVWAMPFIFLPFLILMGPFGLVAGLHAIWMGTGYMLMVQAGYYIGRSVGIITVEPCKLPENPLNSAASL